MSGVQTDLIKLAGNLMRDMRANATCLKAEYRATGHVEYDQFYPRKSKSILDDIDRFLERHYGLMEEELDLIVNCGIRYRMGADDEDDEE